MSNGNKQTPYTQSGKALEQQAANSPNSLVSKHKAFLDTRMSQITKWVRQGVRAEAIVRFALLDLANSEKLRQCSEQSIYLALLACAVTGLEPGALKGEAYLVPFAKEAVFMPGWKGLVKQARRSREVEAIVANVVREQDTFDMDLGTANTIVHKPARKERGEVIGAYGIATMQGGLRELEWMDRDDLDAIQKVAESRGKSPAWGNWEDQMQRKSVIRRLCKRLPLGGDYFAGLALDQADTPAEYKNIIDIETDGEATRTDGRAQVAGGMRDQVESAVETSAPRTNKPAEKPPAEDKPASASNYTKTAAAVKEKDATRTKPALVESKPPIDDKPLAYVPPPKDGYEDRTCQACGVEIEVPITDPPGARCYSCSQQ